MNPDDIRMWDDCEVNEDLNSIRCSEENCENVESDFSNNCCEELEAECNGFNYCENGNSDCIDNDCSKGNAEFIINKINFDYSEENYGDKCNDYQEDKCNYYQKDKCNYGDGCKCQDNQQEDNNCQADCHEKGRYNRRRVQPRPNINMMCMQKMCQMAMQIGCQRGYAIAEQKYRRKMMCIYRILCGE